MNTKIALTLNSAPVSVEDHPDGTRTGRLEQNTRGLWWATWRDGTPLQGSADGADDKVTSFFPTREAAFAALAEGGEGPLGPPAKPVLPPAADPVFAYRTRLGNWLLEATGIFQAIRMLGDACGERVACHLENLVLAEKGK